MAQCRGDGQAKRQLSGVSISNGIVWTADKQRMYYIDSLTRAADVYDYDAATGEVSNTRTVVRIEGETVLRPTACAFGGPDLQTLYITTAKLGLSDDVLRDQPLASRLFCAEPGVQGAAVPRVSLRV